MCSSVSARGSCPSLTTLSACMPSGRNPCCWWIMNEQSTQTADPGGDQRGLSSNGTENRHKGCSSLRMTATGRYETKESGCHDNHLLQSETSRLARPRRSGDALSRKKTLGAKGRDRTASTVSKPAPRNRSAQYFNSSMCPPFRRV